MEVALEEALEVALEEALEVAQDSEDLASTVVDPSTPLTSLDFCPASASTTPNPRSDSTSASTGARVRSPDSITAANSLTMDKLTVQFVPTLLWTNWIDFC